MKKSRLIQWAAAAACLLLIGALLFFVYSRPLGAGLFSWKKTTAGPEKEQLLAAVEQLEIKQVYQYFSSSSISGGEARQLATELQQAGVELYALLDAVEWEEEVSLQRLNSQLDLIIEFNRDSPGFAGIMVDIEPYQSDDWDENADQIMAAMVRDLCLFYDRAVRAELRIYQCVPVWYANRYPQALNTLAARASDGLCVMNYDRNKEQENMAPFVQLAQGHDKEVICAFEFQETGKHGLTEEQTYYHIGLEQALDNFTAIRRHYRCQNMRLAYHYLRPITEMLDEPGKSG